MWISFWQQGLEASSSSLAATAGAFFISFVWILNLARLAPRLGLLDLPGGRKTHASPTPLVGGLAIAFGSIPMIFMVLPDSRPVQSLVLASGVLLITGVLDDLYDLHWATRFFAQITAALVLVYFGGVRINSIGAAFGVGDYHQLGNLSAPFTVIATTGLINAVNMIDGVDGLAGSVGMATLAMLTAAAVYANNTELARGLMIMMGGVAAFLAFNLRTPWVRKSRVFLGNSGSELLGLVIAWGCFRLTQTPAHPVTPVLAPFLIATPVIDCLVLMTHRVRRGRSPFAADRDHLHHLFIDAGLSVSAVILIIVGASLVIGLLAGVALLNHVAQPLFVVGFLILLAAHFMLTAHRYRAVALFSRIVGALRPRTSDEEAPAWASAPTDAALTEKRHAAE